MGLAQDVEERLSLEWSEEEPGRPAPEEGVGPEEGLPRASPQLRPPLRHRSSLETLSVLYHSLPLGAAGSASSLRPDNRSTLKQVQIATETFKMISEHCDVDHPLCARCPEAVLADMDRRITHQEHAQCLYEAMVVQLAGEVEGYEAESVGLEEELAALRLEEEGLRGRLLRSEARRREIAEERAGQLSRAQQLKGEEQRYWSEFNAHQRSMLALRDEQLSLRHQLHYSTEQLAVLKKNNVLSSVFYIWHNGHFGTINGLRLGRLQTLHVEWSEVNAAWGQTAFLLSTLARLAGVRFERFKLVPYGNQSFVEVLEGRRGRILPLYSTSGIRLWTDVKFDLAMVAFLDCLDQLKAHIEQSSSAAHFSLPYRIDKEHIGDGKEFYSVRTQFNTPEKWTKALKFVLTDLRWALAWITTNSIQPPESGTA